MLYNKTSWCQTDSQDHLQHLNATSNATYLQSSSQDHLQHLNTTNNATYLQKSNTTNDQTYAKATNDYVLSQNLNKTLSSGLNTGMFAVASYS